MGAPSTYQALASSITMSHYIDGASDWTLTSCFNQEIPDAAGGGVLIAKGHRRESKGYGKTQKGLAEEWDCGQQGEFWRREAERPHYEIRGELGVWIRTEVKDGMKCCLLWLVLVLVC